MERSNASSFTAYLKEKQRLRAAQQPPPAGATPLSLLQVLADASGHQLPVKDLQSASGMFFTDFAEALKSLKQSGYLTLSGPPAEEVAGLTPLGENVAQLARPR